jgi:hypothetical protein
MSDKPSGHEEEYFARENAERLRKLAAEERSMLADSEKEALKKAHWMKCPKCGLDLRPLVYRGIEVDRCFSCQGTWLHGGEFEKLAGHDGAVQAILNLFAHKKTP